MLGGIWEGGVYLPPLGGGGLGVGMWDLCWHPARAVVKVYRVCLPAAGDGVLRRGFRHRPGKEDERELFQGRLDRIHLQRGSQGESGQQSFVAPLKQKGLSSLWSLTQVANEHRCLKVFIRGAGGLWSLSWEEPKEPV